jgi:hypothetical protein
MEDLLESPRLMEETDLLFMLDCIANAFGGQEYPEGFAIPCRR